MHQKAIHVGMCGFQVRFSLHFFYFSLSLSPSPLSTLFSDIFLSHILLKMFVRIFYYFAATFFWYGITCHNTCRRYFNLDYQRRPIRSIFVKARVEYNKIYSLKLSHHPFDLNVHFAEKFGVEYMMLPLHQESTY